MKLAKGFSLFAAFACLANAQNRVVISEISISSTGAIPSAINDLGHVVATDFGTNTAYIDVNHPFNFARLFAVQDSSLSDTLGMWRPLAINRSDQIAGPKISTQGSYLITDLYKPDVVNVPVDWAAGVNADLTLTGTASLPSPNAFIKQFGEGIQLLGAIGSGKKSWGAGINRTQQITGTAEISDNGPRHAFFWSAATGMRDLGTLGDPRAYSAGYAINRLGQVTGTSEAIPTVTDVAQKRSAFLYDSHTGMQAIDLPGNIDGVGESINAVGQVVGRMSINNVYRPFLYTPGQGAIDLNTLASGTGWQLFDATAINDSGQIVGAGLLNGRRAMFRMNLPLCELRLNPVSIRAPSMAVSFQAFVGVGTGGCRWTPIPSDPWITVDSEGVFTSPAWVTVILDANPLEQPRIGSLYVAGRAIPILQQGTSTKQIFDDVPPDHPFFDYINLMKQLGITSGCSARRYCPDAPLTREQMAVFLVRAVERTDPVAGTYLAAPPDVRLTSPYWPFVAELFSRLGIGTYCPGPEEAFCPDQPVTRAILASYIIRARYGRLDDRPFQYSTTPYFTDVTEAQFPYVQKMRDMGITSGCTPTTYCPDSLVTRAQAAALIVRGLLTPIGD